MKKRIAAVLLMMAGLIAFLPKSVMAGEQIGEVSATLTLNTPLSVEYQVPDQDYYYSFTPTKDGVYAFCSKNNESCDDQAMVLDDQGEEMDLLGNTWINYDFALEARLTAGKTYYLKVSHGEEDGAYDLKVVHAFSLPERDEDNTPAFRPGEQFTLSAQAGDLWTGDQVSYSWYCWNRAAEDETYSSYVGDTSAITVNAPSKVMREETEGYECEVTLNNSYTKTYNVTFYVFNYDSIPGYKTANSDWQTNKDGGMIECTPGQALDLKVDLAYPAGFSGTVSENNTGYTPTFQWSKEKEDGFDSGNPNSEGCEFEDVEGGNTAVLSIASAEKTIYKCTVSLNGESQETYFYINASHLKLNSNNGMPLRRIGETVVLTPDISTTSDEPITYKWIEYTWDGDTQIPHEMSETGSSLSVTKNELGNYPYRCDVTQGNETVSAWFMIYYESVFKNYGGSGYKVLSNPVGKETTLMTRYSDFRGIKASDLTYEWYKGRVEDALKLPGTGPDLKVTPTKPYEVYYCQLTFRENDGTTQRYVIYDPSGLKNASNAGSIGKAVSTDLYVPVLAKLDSTHRQSYVKLVPGESGSYRVFAETISGYDPKLQVVDQSGNVLNTDESMGYYGDGTLLDMDLTKGKTYYLRAYYNYPDENGTFLMGYTDGKEPIDLPGDKPKKEEQEPSETAFVYNKANYEVSQAGEVTYVSASDSGNKVEVPDTVTVNQKTYKVTRVKKNAFSGNKKLKKATIGKNVTVIEKGAFSGCSNLESLTIKGNSMQVIDTEAFSGCKKLKSLTLGKKVKKIGKNAFKNCKKMKSLRFKTAKAKNLTITKGAFSGINKKCVIKVPAKQLKQYKTKLKKAGLPKKVRVIKG